MARDIKTALLSYKSFDEDEENSRLKILQFLDGQENHFCRTNLKGHITGSGFLINKAGERVLMNHHRKLNKWMVFGGHSDGDPVTENVAIKETQEESGILNIKTIGNILDVDVHMIPENPSKQEPEHYHYDICYLLQCCGSEVFKLSDESIELRWCKPDEAYLLADYKRMQRMLEKVF